MVHAPCIGYAVIFSDEAKKDLKKLEKQTIAKIFKKVKALVSEVPDNLDIKKLKAQDSLYRLRAGDYRIIYCIKQKEICIQVVAVGHRKDIDNVLDRRSR